MQYSIKSYCSLLVLPGKIFENAKEQLEAHLHVYHTIVLHSWLTVFKVLFWNNFLVLTVVEKELPKIQPTRDTAEMFAKFATTTENNSWKVFG